MKAETLKLKFMPYTLQLKHVFTVAVNSRTTTPVMLTEIEYGGEVGRGEASMPPYLGESHESAAAFLGRLKLDNFSDPFEIETILEYVDSADKKNTAAKASVDIALHDLVGKLLGKPLYKIWGFPKDKTPVTSYTIGIDKEEMIKRKTIEADEYKKLKVKLGSKNDRQIIEAIRAVTDKPITVDANQGWKDKHFALDMINWLSEKNVEFIEQPMPKEMIDDIAWLSENSPLPVIADEGVQRLDDLKKLYGVYSGINVKLMKCTGLREGKQMLEAAKAFGMKTLLGCMTETSCAVSAAAQISSLADWADLDGNLLISNDPFTGVKIIDGRIILTDGNGIGISNLPS